MKVLIAAGGTGGHIYPGIAVAKEIMSRDAESEVLFVGTARGLEKKIVPDNGFQLSLINIAGLKNVGLATRSISRPHSLASRPLDRFAASTLRPPLSQAPRHFFADDRRPRSAAES